MVVGFTAIYAISAYHHWRCEFEPRSGRGVQRYVIKFVSALRKVSGFLRVLRFPPPIKLTPRHNWNIVESGVKQTHIINLQNIGKVKAIGSWKTGTPIKRPQVYALCLLRLWNIEIQPWVIAVVCNHSERTFRCLGAVDLNTPVATI
jgi:hypothetical protein